MFDLTVIMFSLMLVVAGVWMVTLVRRNFKLNQHVENNHPTFQPIDQKVGLRQARAMERRRYNVWWKIDGLYADFLNRTAVEPSPDLHNQPNSGNDLEEELVSFSASEVLKAFTEWHRIREETQSK